MLRSATQISKRFLTQAGAARPLARWLSAESDAERAFSQKWEQVGGNLAEPLKMRGLLTREEVEEPAKGTLPSDLVLNVFCPHKVFIKNEKVKSVTVPGASGDFGILPGHEPTVAMLRPGVMTVTGSEGSEQKLFVSSGYAFVHANSTADICALETTKLEDLDKDAINEGLANATSELSKASTDEEKAVAEIGVQVYSALKASVH